MKKMLACLIAIASFAAFSATPAAAANPAGEVMTDKCSSDVAIVGSYNALPNSNGAVILNRGPNSSTGWTQPFQVSLSGAGHIRWWCHSIIGNWFDVGTWRINDLSVGTACDMSAGGSLDNCHANVNVSIGSSAWFGWTPERSRCNNHSTRIRARIAPGRLLQIECLGK